MIADIPAMAPACRLDPAWPGCNGHLNLARRIAPSGEGVEWPEAGIRRNRSTGIA